MLKFELVNRLAQTHTHLYRRDVERVVNTILDEIALALTQDRRVELRGFGAFSTKRRAARTGHNPRTGQVVNVAAKRVPFFKAGKKLREQLNETKPGADAS